MKTADPAAGEIAAITAALEPFIFVEAFGQPYFGLAARRIAGGPYRFEGSVRGDRAGIVRDTPAREGRARMMERAEEAIATLEAAGWLLVGDLRIEVKGKTAPWTQTFGGQLVKPGEHYDLEVRLRFEVDRPR